MWYFVTSSPASFLFEIMDLWLEGNLYSYFISETGLKTGSCPKKFEEDLTLNPFTGFKRPLLSEDLLRIVKLYGKISHELRTIKDEDTLGRINLTSTNEEGATFISCEVFTKVLKGIFKMNLFLHAHVVLKVILSRAKKNQLVIYESSPFEEETGTNGLETGYSEIEYLKGEKDFIIIPKKVLIYFMAKSTQLLIDGTKCADSRQNSRKRELATQLENVMIELLLLQDNEITTKVFFIFMRSFFSNSAMFELANDFWPFFLVSLSPSENHESNYFSKGIRGSKSILIRISGSESFFQSKKLLSLMLEKMFSGGQTALEFLRTDMLFILFQEILLFSRKEIPNLGLFEEFVFALFRKMMTQLHALLGSELKDILEKFPNLSDKENESFQAALNPPINISFSNIPMSIFSMALLKSPHILALLNRLTSHDPRNIDTSRSIMNYFPSSVQYLERLEIILWPFLAELPTRELRLYLLCALLGQVPRFSALTSFASVKKQQCLFNFSAKNKPFCLLPLNPKKHNYYWMYYVAVKIPQSFDAFVWKNNAFRAFMGSDLEGAESVRDDFVLILLKIIPQQKSYPEYIFLATRMLNVYLPALTKLSSSSLDYQINYSSPKELYMSSYETYLKEIQSFDIKSATSNTSTETDFDIAILYKYLQPSFYPFIKLTLDNIFKKLQDFTKEPRLLSEFKDVHYFYIYGLILTNFKFSANSLAIYHIFHWLLFQINNQKEIPGTKCQAQEGYCKSTVYRRLSSDFSVIKESSHYFEHCLLTTSFVDVFLEHFIAWNDWYGVAELFSRLYRVPEFSSSIPTLKKQYLNLRNNQEDFLLAGLDSRDTFYKVIMATLHHIAESSSVDVILDSIPDFWTLQALESYLLSFFTTSTSNFYRYSFPDRLQSRSHLISILNPTNSNTDKLQGLAAKLQDSIPLQRLEGARAAIITLFNELARRRLRTVRDIRAISQNNIQLLAQQSLAPDLLIIWNGAVNVDPRLVQLRQLVLKTRPHILTFK